MNHVVSTEIEYAVRYSRMKTQAEPCDLFQFGGDRDEAEGFLAAVKARAPIAELQARKVYKTEWETLP